MKESKKISDAIKREKDEAIVKFLDGEQDLDPHDISCVVWTLEDLIHILEVINLNNKKKVTISTEYLETILGEAKNTEAFKKWEIWRRRE